jgi:type II secretory pathway component GspD/PulD (secretin)
MIYANTNANGANLVITSDGYIYRSTSSLKYKRDVEDATHGLAEVMQLRSVTYKGKAKSDNEKILGGLIAEEVHAAGLTEFVQYAEDGSPDALAYGNMVSLCIKAIQELKAEIDALKGAK